MNFAAMTGGNNDGIAPANRDAFVSFSGCSRSCSGSKFAMTEAILVFAQHVVNFSFELPPHYELCPLNIGLNPRQRDGMIMTMTWRK